MTPSPSVESFREKLKQIRDTRLGVSGMNFQEANDWFNERAAEALALLPSPEWKSMEADWVLVPREPTEEMIEAADDANADYRGINLNRHAHLGPEGVYRAMIAASPIPSLGGGNSMTSVAESTDARFSEAATEAHSQSEGED